MTICYCSDVLPFWSINLYTGTGLRQAKVFNQVNSAWPSICSVLLYIVQARLRLAEVVEREDVNEAMRLMEMSKDSLNPSVEHTRFVISQSINQSVRVALIIQLLQG